VIAPRGECFPHETLGKLDDVRPVFFSLSLVCASKSRGVCQFFSAILNSRSRPVSALQPTKKRRFLPRRITPAEGRPLSGVFFRRPPLHRQWSLCMDSLIVRYCKINTLRAPSLPKNL